MSKENKWVSNKDIYTNKKLNNKKTYIMNYIVYTLV